MDDLFRIDLMTAEELSEFLDDIFLDTGIKAARFPDGSFNLLGNESVLALRAVPFENDTYLVLTNPRFFKGA